MVIYSMANSAAVAVFFYRRPLFFGGLPQQAIAATTGAGPHAA